MDSKTYEINNLRVLNDYLAQTIEVLARTQRIGLNRDFNRDMPGLSHTQFGATPFGVPVQGIDPRTVDYTGGLGHSPYGVYPSYNYAMQSVPAWTSQQHLGGLPTSIDPFFAQRSGLSHSTATPWTGWNPFTAEIVRQREIARQQYEAMCRACGF
ncbi:hypothetical protein [Polyangium mundeleinium]|uniref:Uncharacterized protein n=1 Tax=Polyangium mundeleinium TaxID=2995306 RepID=A0ABT5EZU8_9BACT|nr:hypothetical protein [Polyangium mundeleinium]MDC0747366.1 hypothetical protein [Polyangium mundeleinium]